MPKTKAQKQELITALKEKLDVQNALIFVDYKGLPVQGLNTLRKQLKPAQGDLKVAKKTLLEKAFQEKKIPVQARSLEGQVGVVFALGDPMAAIKAVSLFAKTNEKLRILGGFMDTVIIDAAGMLHLAELPSKDQLRAQFVGTLAAPLSGFATVLQGNIKGLLVALNAIQEKK
ncbi:MAG: 50S ribosomal protein L10 [Candidatus Yanofskybacteria bacterium]|nr:50S ribosomal protein L10 [Candidatus Yanofskybacteria bacterium]